MENNETQTCFDFIKYLSANKSKFNAPSAKELSSIRRGISPISEVYAYPYVLPHLPDNASQSTEKALLRAAAIVAEYKDSIRAFDKENPEDTRLSLGRFLSAVAQKRGEDFTSDHLGSFGSRISYIHTQDLDEVALTIHRLLALASSGPKLDHSLDYIDLTKTLLYWGNGISTQSNKLRLRIVKDFYQFKQPKNL